MEFHFDIGRGLEVIEDDFYGFLSAVMYSNSLLERDLLFKKILEGSQTI